VGLAEGTPLHGLSEQYLFSAHMTQHILILLIAPPLLLLGTPEWLLRPVTTLRWVSPVVRVVTKPVVAGVQFNAVLALWHIPAVYDAALGNHVLHYTQHFVFVFSAVLMWWPVVSPLPEHPSLHYAGQLLYLFVVNLPQKLLAVFLTLVSRPVYPTYAHADRILPISAIHDQQLGGAIMWAPMAMIFFAAFAIVFFVWFNKAEREDQAQREAGYR
jgi:putative membrane protein